MSRVARLIKRGGIKAKLIGFVAVLIFVTITILSIFSIQLMKNSIEEKAFEVAASTLNRIADFSSLPLLERSYESKLNLEEVLKELKNSQIEGLLHINIYAHEKVGEDSRYGYFAGFDGVEGENLENAELIKRLNADSTGLILRDSMKYEGRDVYRFVKPIFYNYKGKRLLLGVALLHYDKEAINGAIKKVLHTILLLSGVILVAALLIVYYVGLKYTRPILEIADAATKVHDGNLDITLKIDTNDELEELAKRFNHMVGGLKEKRHMQKYVSDSTIGMIQNSSYAELNLGGEYRELTILFSDIRNFTALSETKKPDEVVEIVNFYLDLQSEIIKRYSGDIDKFVGDEVMVAFSGEGSIDRAMACAVSIQEKILSENITREQRAQTICEVGIGICYGGVIVGNIGSKDRMDCTSIGSTVNLAARLCSQAAPAQILIEATSYEQSQKIHIADMNWPIEVKGFSVPVKTYRIDFKG